MSTDRTNAQLGFERVLTTRAFLPDHAVSLWLRREPKTPGMSFMLETEESRQLGTPRTFRSFGRYPDITYLKRYVAVATSDSPSLLEGRDLLRFARASHLCSNSHLLAPLIDGFLAGDMKTTALPLSPPPGPGWRLAAHHRHQAAFARVEPSLELCLLPSGNTTRVASFRPLDIDSLMTWFRSVGALRSLNPTPDTDEGALEGVIKTLADVRGALGDPADVWRVLQSRAAWLSDEPLVERQRALALYRDWVLKQA